MSQLYRKISSIIIHGWYWLLDYLYVGYWQIHGAVIPINPNRYNRLSKPRSEKISVVLIPGVYENWQFLKPIADVLYTAGYLVHVVPNIGRTTEDVEIVASKIHAYLKAQSITRCIIVAHSKGGLVGKYMLMDPKEGTRIEGMITLNTPFTGSRYARLIPTKTIRVFLPNSPILTTLTKNALVNTRIISIYGTFDPHIPSGSYLEGAENIQLPVQGHFRIISSELVLAVILKSVHALNSKALRLKS